MNLDVAFGVFWFVEHQYLSAVLFALMFLLFGLFLYRRRRYDARYGRRLFLWYIVIVLVQIIAAAAVYWIEWHKYDSCGYACRLFFPPYSNFYFNQTIVQWSATAAFDACVGLFGGILFSLFARATRGRIIDQLDVDVLTVGGMVAGWPNILLFYGLVFSVTVLMTIARAIVERTASIRMIITPALPLSAAAVAVFGDYLAKLLKLYEIGVTLF